MTKKLAILLIRFYQKYLSFDTGTLRFLAGGTPVCRHSPTCSEYTKRAVEKYGVLRGLFLGLKKIGGCRPTFREVLEI